MRYKVFVGTHHKTGTQWMKGVFSDVAQFLGVPFIHLSKMDEPKMKERMTPLLEDGEGRFIAFHDHSRFFVLPEDDSARGVRMIRDPLDVIISAARYHETTTATWVQQPRSEFGGMSVQEKIRSLQSFQEKLQFEIEHVSKNNLKALGDFDGRGVVRDIFYERWMDDPSMAHAAFVFDWLGFDSYEIVICLCALWRRSLFGQGKHQVKNHVKDGRSKQHEGLLSSETLELFEKLYGDLRSKLGYTDRLERDIDVLDSKEAGELLSSSLSLFAAEDKTDKVVSSLKLCVEAEPARTAAYHFLIVELIEENRNQEARDVFANVPQNLMETRKFKKLAKMLD